MTTGPSRTYEDFPARIVLVALALAVSVYGLGIYIVGGLGLPYAILYVGYCLWLEAQVMRKSCVNCHYYGRICAFGRGWLSARFFKRGDPRRFVEREISWRDIIPDMMTLAIPLVMGIVILIRQFDWLVAAAMAALVILALPGNAFVRGSCACKYCKQRELGCPAQKLFEGKKN